MPWFYAWMRRVRFKPWNAVSPSFRWQLTGRNVTPAIIFAMEQSHCLRLWMLLRVKYTPAAKNGIGRKSFCCSSSNWKRPPQKTWRFMRSWIITPPTKRPRYAYGSPNIRDGICTSSQRTAVGLTKWNVSLPKLPSRGSAGIAFVVSHNSAMPSSIISNITTKIPSRLSGPPPQKRFCARLRTSVNHLPNTTLGFSITHGKQNMKNRCRIYIRGKHSGGKVWWIEDNQTGKRESLRTTEKNKALEMLLLRNSPCQQAAFHAQMARTHLLVSNPQNANRTCSL
jgi:hypothetical protein